MAKFIRLQRVYPNLPVLDESMPYGHTWGGQKKAILIGLVRKAHTRRFKGETHYPEQYRLDFENGHRCFYETSWVDKHFISEDEHIERLLTLAGGDDRHPRTIDARNALMDIAERLTVEVSAFRADAYRTAFENLLYAFQRNGYRPTLSTRFIETKLLADIYDFTQKVRGNKVVAFRAAC